MEEETSKQRVLIVRIPHAPHYQDEVVDEWSQRDDKQPIILIPRCQHFSN